MYGSKPGLLLPDSAIFQSMSYIFWAQYRLNPNNSFIRNLEILRTQKNYFEILNRGSYDQFLWCLEVVELGLALKSKPKRQQITTTVSNYITELASSLYSVFYDFTFFSKITEIKKPENEYQLKFLLNGSAQ